MKDKIPKIRKLDSDLAYLQDEYANIRLYGSAPDCDVHFDTMIEWLAKNKDTVRFMIDTAEAIEKL